MSSPSRHRHRYVEQGHVGALVVLVRNDEEVACWPVAGADLTVVDLLARLQLNARRLGYAIRLRHATEELTALLRFVGLGVEVGGEPEEGEEVGVEEVVVADDPVA
jgi:hypothetical protein